MLVLTCLTFPMLLRLEDAGEISVVCVCVCVCVCVYVKLDLVTVKYLSVQFSRSVVSDSLWPRESQHARPACPSPTPGVYPNSCPLSRWCHPTISSSVIPFSSCPQSFPASGSFQMNQPFASGGQHTGVSASASVLPMNTQVWSPLLVIVIIGSYKTMGNIRASYRNYG